MTALGDTAQAPSPPHADTISARGWFLLVTMYVTGLLLSGALSSYDVWTRPIAVCLTLLNSLVSWLLLWFALGALRVAPGRRLIGTLWVPLAWNTLMISQYSFVGFLLIPLEVLAATLVLRKRVQLSWLGALLLAGATRMISMGLTYAAKPIVVSWFPWRA